MDYTFLAGGSAHTSPSVCSAQSLGSAGSVLSSTPDSTLGTTGHYQPESDWVWLKNELGLGLDWVQFINWTSLGPGVGTARLDLHLWLWPHAGN